MMNSNTEIKSSNICQVCGGLDAKKNYNVLCCPSCKMFFRRNALNNLNIDRCLFGKDCDVTTYSRGACKCCRLKKCFSIGMEKDLIRGQYGKQKKKKIQNFNPIIISTIDLLCHDRSLLSIEEWSLLTYINNIYNEKSFILTSRNIIDNQSKQSPKTRLKMTLNNYIYITKECFVSVGKFLSQIPQFNNISINDQCALIERNTYTTGGIAGIIALREVDIYSNPYYYDIGIYMYGSRLINQGIDISHHTDSNILLLKLFLSILCFSTCTDILEKPVNNTNANNSSCSNIRFVSNTKSLFEIQNIYIELLYKYMLFRFGYKETILRFFGLVKTALDLIKLLEKRDDNQTFSEIVDKIAKQTEQLLILQNQAMEE